MDQMEVKAQTSEKKDDVSTSKLPELSTQVKSEPKPIAAPQSPDPAMPDKKSSSLDDELKPVDSFEKAFAGQEDFSEPLDAAKLTAEIKPAVKDINTGVKNKEKDLEKEKASIAQKTETPKKVTATKTAVKAA